MKLLLDTPIAVWAMTATHRLPPAMALMLEDPENEPWFSVVSVWELTVKRAAKQSFAVDPELLRRALLASGYLELPIQVEHVLRVGVLPPLHGDPFDRLLIAQAQHEALALLTVDRHIRRYPNLSLP